MTSGLLTGFRDRLASQSFLLLDLLAVLLDLSPDLLLLAPERVIGPPSPRAPPEAKKGRHQQACRASLSSRHSHAGAFTSACLRML